MSNLTCSIKRDALKYESPLYGAHPVTLLPQFLQLTQFQNWSYLSNRPRTYICTCIVGDTTNLNMLFFIVKVFLV